ncbi:MAG: hypothetical protein EKK29_21870 [Hyphomicrobiales bacterium]|nr:MAG: hypothetical protein EKK29_21870 [Hyphomicrobiales bacterium]
MDDDFFALLQKWAILETRHHAAEKAQADALALELSSAEDAIFDSRPVTQAGALAHLRFLATHLERRGGDEPLSAALRNAIDVLGRA